MRRSGHNTFTLQVMEYSRRVDAPNVDVDGAVIIRCGPALCDVIAPGLHKIGSSQTSCDAINVDEPLVDWHERVTVAVYCQFDCTTLRDQVTALGLVLLVVNNHLIWVGVGAPVRTVAHVRVRKPEYPST